MSNALTPVGDWFDARDHEGGTHSTECWQQHPGCAYLAGRREAARLIEAAAVEAARTSRDFGRGFSYAAKVAIDGC
jgi:hypothetical protein